MTNLQNNQTAMQELWSYVKDDKTIPFEHYRKLRNKILHLIEKEKVQIIEAYNEAENKCEYFIEEHKWNRYYETSEQYYKETYEK